MNNIGCVGPRTPYLVFALLEADSLEEAELGSDLSIKNVLHALSISDRAYILENGGVIMEGKGKALLREEEVKKAYLGL